MEQQRPSNDLAAFDTAQNGNDGARMVVRHPETYQPLMAADGQEVTILVAGADSEVAQKAVRKATNKRLASRRLKLKAEELEEEKIETVALCTLDWHGIVVDGEQVPCTVENVKKVYRRFRWLMDQVDEFSGDRANYLGN